MKRKKFTVLMCCSEVKHAKGGMVTVVQNYLSYHDWGNVEIIFVPTHTSGGRVFKSLYFLKGYLKALWVLATRKPDAAHLHVSERGSFYRKAWLLTLCGRFRVPVILHHHGAEFEDFYSRLSPGKKRYVRKILEAAEQNLVLCEYLVSPLKEKAPGARVSVLRNAVSVPEKNPYDETGRYLLFLGRIGSRKGAYDLLAVLKELDRELDADIRLCMCGDGEEKEAKEYIKRLGLEHRIGNLGWISGGEKEQILKHTMVNILPSYHEGLPMTILETMARGIPNISTRIAAVPEVIEDGVNGFLIEPGDRQALKQAILTAAGDGKLRSRMSQAAYETIKEKYSLEEHMKRLKEIYGSVRIHR